MLLLCQMPANKVLKLSTASPVGVFSTPLLNSRHAVMLYIWWCVNLQSGLLQLSTKSLGGLRHVQSFRFLFFLESFDWPRNWL